MNIWFIDSLCFSSLKLLFVKGNRLLDDLVGPLPVLKLEHLDLLLLQLLVILKEPTYLSYHTYGSVQEDAEAILKYR